ncbi:response regulator [Sphingomonas sp. I4]
MTIKPPTILVVDDQPLLLLHVQFAFEDAGYRVIQATSADEALVALDRHPEIRAVFTDVTMPGTLDGAALATRLREIPSACRDHRHVRRRELCARRPARGRSLRAQALYGVGHHPDDFGRGRLSGTGVQPGQATWLRNTPGRPIRYPWT